CAQFFAQPGQFGHSVFVELLDGLVIDSGSSVVAPDSPEGRLEIALGQDFSPESEPYGCRLALFEPGQHAVGPDRMFHPPPTFADVCGLFRLAQPSHSRRSIGFVIRHRLPASTFLRPLAPRALPRFFATTDALTPARRLFGHTGHEHRSGPDGSPCLPRPHLQPFCPQPPRRPSHGICARSRFGSARGRWPVDPALGREQREQFPSRSWRGLRTALAGSPVGVAESGLRCVMFDMSRYYGRVVHLRQLSTSCRHGAVAFGYRRVNVPPDGDLHPAVCTPSQAHERARLGRSQSAPRRLALAKAISKFWVGCWMLDVRCWMFRSLPGGVRGGSFRAGAPRCRPSTLYCSHAHPSSGLRTPIPGFCMTCV